LVCRSAVGNGDFGLGGCMNLSSATTAYDGLREYNVGTRGTWTQLASKLGDGYGSEFGLGVLDERVQLVHVVVVF
jgi:hypothetical protein